MENNFLSIPAAKVKPYTMDGDTTITTLKNLGVFVGQNVLADIAKNYSMDGLPALQTAASIANPVQFLQYFIPNAIKIVTQARKADELLGRDVGGTWKDNEVVLPVVEQAGQARPYGDKTNANVNSMNVNFERRTICRFEQDVEVGILEQERGSAMRVDVSGVKRDGAADSLAISANEVAFYGYNDGDNRTYGILNDANLSAFVTVTTGAGGYTTWASKTFNEIVNDLKTAFSALRTKTGTNYDPYSDGCVLGIASSCIDMLDTMNNNGTQSVKEWLQSTHPNCRIVPVPQFDEANGGSNVFYLIADRLQGQKVVYHFIPETLRLVGTEKKAKGFLEVYSNATAGVLVSQPVGVVRYTGI